LIELEPTEFTVNEGLIGMQHKATKHHAVGKKVLELLSYTENTIREPTRCCPPFPKDKTLKKR